LRKISLHCQEKQEDGYCPIIGFKITPSLHQKNHDIFKSYHPNAELLLEHSSWIENIPTTYFRMYEYYLLRSEHSTPGAMVKIGCAQAQISHPISSLTRDQKLGL